MFSGIFAGVVFVSSTQLGSPGLAIFIAVVCILYPIAAALINSSISYLSLIDLKSTTALINSTDT